MNKICIALSIFAAGFAFESAFAAEFKIGEYTFTLPDGFMIEKVTDESIVKRPISADFDFEGNLYVTEASGTNDHVEKQLEEKPHRVLKLSDTNGDGKFDKQTVFVDKIQFPEGALFHRGSLYVTAPPSIWKFTDTNNDGVADKEEEWLNAKTLTYCANDLHGPFAGPDGYIYWCKGAFAEQSWPQADGSTFKTKAAHIFRKPVEGGFVEPVMTGGMDNPVELVFSPTGEMFFCSTFIQHPADGKRDGIIRNVHGAVYGKDHGVINGFPRTGDFLPPLVHLGAAAPAGLTMLKSGRGTDFGSKYRGSIFCASFNMHKVTSLHWEEDAGATYQATAEDFLVCDSFDFHPTDILEDADGSLLVIDTGGWYKICCPTSQLYKPEVLGGIYRIRREGLRKVKDARGMKIKWKEQTNKQLCEFLNDNRFVVRSRAKEELVSRGSSVIQSLRNHLIYLRAEGGFNREVGILWTLSQIDDEKARHLIRVKLDFSDQHAYPVDSSDLEKETFYESHAFSIAANIVGTKKDQKAVPLLLKVVDHEQAEIRRAAVEALGRIGDAAAVEPILKSCRVENDRILQHSITYALIEIEDAEKTRAGLQSDNPATVRTAIIALDQMPGGNLTANEIAPLLSAKDDEVRRAAFNVATSHEDWIDELLPRIEKRLTGNNSTDLDEEIQFLCVATKRESGHELAAKILNSKDSTADSMLIVLRALNVSESKNFALETQSVLRLIDSDNERLLNETHKLLQRNPALVTNEATIERLLELADDSESSATMRLRALLAVPNASPVINEQRWKLIRDNVVIGSDSMARSVAAQLLRKSKLNRDQLLGLVEVLPDIGPLEIESALTAIGKSKEKLVAHELLEKLPNAPAFHTIPEEKVAKLLPGFNDQFQKGLKSLLNKRATEKQEQLAALDDRLNRLPSGNAASGQKIFQSASAACSACHTAGYLGGKLGPDLTRIGKSRQKRDLLESVLFPSASFVRGFEPMIVTTLDGQTFSGFVRDENEQHLVLVNSERKEIRIPREDIDEMTRGDLSIMPAGLDKQLSDQQLADLLEFLMTAQ